MSLINVSSKTVDQSVEPGGGASAVGMANVLFDGNMAEEAFCTTLKKKKEKNFLSAASSVFRHKDALFVNSPLFFMSIF